MPRRTKQIDREVNRDKKGREYGASEHQYWLTYNHVRDTRDALDKLGFRVGDTAMALAKATVVMVIND